MVGVADTGSTEHKVETGSSPNGSDRSTGRHARYYYYYYYYYSVSMSGIVSWKFHSPDREIFNPEIGYFSHSYILSRITSTLWIDATYS